MAKHDNQIMHYIRKLYAPQDALLERVDATLHRIGFPIHIGAEEGKLLQLLIAMNQVKTIVEIGTLAGYSTVWMARALPKEGHIYTINKDKLHIATAKETFAACEVKDRITMLEGVAQTMLATLEDRAPFDMIFIDADKISYPEYLDWADKNIRTGGLIIADNTLLGGAATMDTPPDNIAPTTWKNMRSFNERLADENRYHSVMIATAEGLTVAIKK
jgi:predicted O-methyltransferase YrrM